MICWQLLLVCAEMSPQQTVLPRHYFQCNQYKKTIKLSGAHVSETDISCYTGHFVSLAIVALIFLSESSISVGSMLKFTRLNRTYRFQNNILQFLIQLNHLSHVTTVIYVKCE